MSNENSPVGSVSDASMSPRASLTTKVLPSRILTSSSLMIPSSRSRGPDGVRARPVRNEPLGQHEQRRVALDDQLAAQHRRHRVQLAGDDPVERRLVGAQDGVRLAILARDGQVPLGHGDEPAVGLPVVHEIEAERRRHPLKRRLVSPAGELVEELRGRIRRCRHSPFSVRAVPACLLVGESGHVISITALAGSSPRIVAHMTVPERVARDKATG